MLLCLSLKYVILEGGKVGRVFFIQTNGTGWFEKKNKFRSSVWWSLIDSEFPFSFNDGKVCYVELNLCHGVWKGASLNFRLLKIVVFNLKFLNSNLVKTLLNIFYTFNRLPMLMVIMFSWTSGYTNRQIYLKKKKK